LMRRSTRHPPSSCAHLDSIDVRRRDFHSRRLSPLTPGLTVKQTVKSSSEVSTPSWSVWSLKQKLERKLKLPRRCGCSRYSAKASGYLTGRVTENHKVLRDREVGPVKQVECLGTKLNFQSLNYGGVLEQPQIERRESRTYER